MKVLVCLIGQLRAADVTWPSFKKLVLDNLGADLAVSAEGNEYDDANPYWQNADIRLSTPRPVDLSAAFHAIQERLVSSETREDWRQILAVPGNWLGGLGPSNEHPGAGAILTYKKWAFLQQLISTGACDRYDYFVISRSDFLWLAPHPPVFLLAPSRIWIPAGEDYGGVNDRHAVVSGQMLRPYLDGLTPLLTHPEAARRAGLRRGSWNIESYLQWQLRRANVLNNVRRLPYLMALVRSESDPAGWSGGVWNETKGVYIKTPAELQSAETNAAYFTDAAVWRRHLHDTPADDHVLRRSLLVRFSRLRLLTSRWRPAFRLGKRCVARDGIVVGLGGNELYYLQSRCAARLTPAQKRTPWRFAPATRLEKMLLGSTDIHYVRCGQGLLHARSGSEWRFRRTPPAMSSGFVKRCFAFLRRTCRASYFSLAPFDDTAHGSAKV